MSWDATFLAGMPTGLCFMQSLLPVNPTVHDLLLWVLQVMVQLSTQVIPQLEVDHVHVQDVKRVAQLHCPVQLLMLQGWILCDTFELAAMRPEFKEGQQSLPPLLVVVRPVVLMLLQNGEAVKCAKVQRLQSLKLCLHMSNGSAHCRDDLNIIANASWAEVVAELGQTNANAAAAEACSAVHAQQRLLSREHQNLDSVQ